MKAIPVHTKTCITMYDVQEIMGLNMHDFEFMQLAPNDSYIMLDMSEEHMWELMEDVAWERNRFNDGRVRRLENEAELIIRLRDQGIKEESILVWVSW